MSGFDPIRREVARIALERLLIVRRYVFIRQELKRWWKKREGSGFYDPRRGEAAAIEVGVPGIHPELLRFAWSYEVSDEFIGQNALKLPSRLRSCRASGRGNRAGCAHGETCRSFA